MQQTTEDKTLDKWEQKLEDELIILQNCQSQKDLSSCSDCEVFLSCTIRKEYIKAVYESMNKGSSGGFEF